MFTLSQISFCKHWSSSINPVYQKILLIYCSHEN